MLFCAFPLQSGATCTAHTAMPGLARRPQEHQYSLPSKPAKGSSSNSAWGHTEKWDNKTPVSGTVWLRDEFPVAWRPDGIR
jgi:hypothetical protein